MKLHVDAKCEETFMKLLLSRKLKFTFSAFRTKISSFFPALIGFMFPTLLPIAHIVVLWYFWQAYARFVDKRFCSCSCWDTVFKATYESGIASYKNFYFNATINTLKIWLLIVVGIISLYECIKYLTKLIISNQLRYSMAFLFCLSIFSHYYAWWAYMNYLNDDFYSQWNHQTFFTVTQIKHLTLLIESIIYLSSFFFTAYWTVLDGVCDPSSRQREFCNVSEGFMHRWHRASSYHCRQCRPIYPKCLPGRGLPPSNRQGRRIYDPRSLSFDHPSFCFEARIATKPTTASWQNHQKGHTCNVCCHNIFVSRCLVALIQLNYVNSMCFSNMSSINLILFTKKHWSTIISKKKETLKQI